MARGPPTDKGRVMAYLPTTLDMAMRGNGRTTDVRREGAGLAYRSR